MAILIYCCESTSLWAQHPQLMPADSLQTTSQLDSQQKSQPLNIGKKEIQTKLDALDSTQFASVTDSLMGALLSSRKSDNYQPDPIRSMWLGLVFPGGGQIYNRRYWKLPIVYGGFLGCAYALTWNNQMLRDYQQAYLDITDTDPNTNSYEQMLPLGYDITGKEERFKTIFKNKKNYYRKYRDMSIFAFAGVYLISIIDAYVDAELSTFDLDHDLSLNFKASFIQIDQTSTKHYRNIPALSCQLGF